MSVLERKYLSALVSSSEADQLAAMRSPLPETVFSVYSAEYAFILSHFEQFGKIPSIDLLQNAFPQFLPVTEIQESIQELSTALVTKANYLILSEYTQKILKALERGVYSGVPKAVEIVSSIQDRLIVDTTVGEVEYGSAVDLSLSLYASYADKTKRKRILPPYSMLVKHRMVPGFEPQNLVTLFGRLGMGKTWVLLNFLVSCVMQGVDTMLVSCEMTVEEIITRLDALVFGLNCTDIQFGLLSEEEKEVFFENRKSFSFPAKLYISDASDIFRASNRSRPLAAILSRAKERGVSALFIDSAHLLFGLNDGVSMVEEAYKVSRSLKRDIAKAGNLMTFVSLQAGRKSEDKKGVVRGGAANVQWADAFGQDSDYLFELYGQRGDLKRNLAVLKARHGCEGEIIINFSLNPVDLTEKMVVASSTDMVAEVSVDAPDVEGLR